jgi:hypothetical protein
MPFLTNASLPHLLHDGSMGHLLDCSGGIIYHKSI